MLSESQRIKKREYNREYFRNRYQTDSEYRRKCLEYIAEYQRNKYHTDPEYRRKCLESWKKHRELQVKKETCDIIRKHHEEMKDDPEHLTTEFMKKLIGIDCDGR